MEPDKKKKKKQKVKYNILFVPDVATADVKRFSLGMGIVKFVCSVVVILLAAAFIYCYYLTNHVKVASASINSLRSELEALNTENLNLSEQNGELQEKIALLSGSLNDKVKEEEERLAVEGKKYIPSGFPIKGTASYNEELTTYEEDPAAIFNASIGTSVISTAYGVVISVDGDDTLGYVIQIDHGNGYISVYRNGSVPTVSEGDEVTSTTELFNINQRHEELIYQIKQNGAYIDPLGLMEIYG